ncbi:MAG TPA: serine/threonine-protein kinase, partial [Candidatus Aminicenantes bacterium]|nr:serine/threonine-protein kinase [Candidatus Aminicenantes bacterium]
SLYIAMEFVDGLPLSRMLRDGGPLSLPTAKGLMDQLLDVLDRLHQKGVVHRDLKPENLLVCRSEPRQFKLLDFGLALRESQTRLTQTGTVMGTLHYLPPERILEGISSAKGDVYGAGVLFYEMVTGRNPFDGEGPLEVIQAIVEHDCPSPDRFRSDLPSSLVQLIEAMLDRDPARRPTAREARGSLSEVELVPTSG